MRRVIGLDINGLKDAGARDWDPDEPNERVLEPVTVDGGIESVAIQQASGDWIGGPQASLAPHGRGAGWGELGDPARRIAISTAIKDLHSGASHSRARMYLEAVRALSRGAEDVVHCVPDVPSFNEAAQGRVLSLCRQDRRTHWLLWRPVAAFLAALESGVIPREGDGQKFRFLIHTGDGIEVQVLRLRQDSDHRDHFAPERDGFGWREFPEVGLTQLRDRAHQAVLSENPTFEPQYCERSALGFRLLCGSASFGEREILRRNNGNWIELKAPKITAATILPFTALVDAEQAVERDVDVAASFLVTPLSDQLAEVLLSRLATRFPGLRRMNWDAIARGALVAGRFIERGLPHYFDRLSPIALAVMKGHEPVFEDLVGSTATLPANREYVSLPYRDLQWLSGKREIEFYVSKGATEVRHWKVQLSEAPPRDVAVELRLRQTPGQSWAKLSLTSPEWEPLQRSPILLDWASLSPIEGTEEDVLERLRAPPPTVPVRIVERPHIDFWNGTNRLAGILEALHNARAAGEVPSPDRLAELLSRSQRDPNTGARYWPIGTDGELPDELSETDRQAFTSALRRCEAVVAAAAQVRPRSNGALRSLTWAFTYCPERTKEIIVETLEKDLQGRAGLLLAPLQARTVLTQGAGRAVDGVERLRRVLQVLVKRPVNTDTLNALAMILSRRAEAPQALTPELVQQILTIVSIELVALTEQLSFKLKFRNALSALAGLFRYREVNEYALMAGRDALAGSLGVTIEKLDKLLLRHRHRVPQYAERKAMVAAIDDYLKGFGDPNILLRIEDLDD